MANDTPEAERLDWPAGTAAKLADLQARHQHWIFKYIHAGLPITGERPAWAARLRGHLFGNSELAAETPEELEALIEIADGDPPKPFVSAF